eukprot:SAG11_NODE_1418_length_4962_cov_3.782644_4_plen_263_part_00
MTELCETHCTRINRGWVWLLAAALAASTALHGCKWHSGLLWSGTLGAASAMATAVALLNMLLDAAAVGLPSTRWLSQQLGDTLCKQLEPDQLPSVLRHSPPSLVWSLCGLLRVGGADYAYFESGLIDWAVPPSILDSNDATNRPPSAVRALILVRCGHGRLAVGWVGGREDEAGSVVLLSGVSTVHGDLLVTVDRWGEAEALAVSLRPDGSPIGWATTTAAEHAAYWIEQRRVRPHQTAAALRSPTRFLRVRHPASRPVFRT